MKDKMLCRAGLPESEFNGMIHCELDWMNCLRSQLLHVKLCVSWFELELFGQVTSNHSNVIYHSTSTHAYLQDEKS